MEFGSKICVTYEDRLKRYGTTPFYIGKNPPNPHEFRDRNRPFKGKMYSIKMWNDKKELVFIMIWVNRGEEISC